MINFLFWNINKKQMQLLIKELVFLYDIDVLVLAESTINPNEMLNLLNSDGNSNYHYSPNRLCTKIQIFTRFSSEFFYPLVEDDRTTIRHLVLPGRDSILLSAVHLPSKMHYDDDSQSFAVIELVELIKEAERQACHSRTILVGDLNMNPFENGVIMAQTLHAVMSRTIAQRRARVVNGHSYQFFYNPMWSLLGDASSGPPGTYYYESSTPKSFYWNSFDQLLIRPDLLDQFRNDDVQVLHNIGQMSLLTNRGVPNKKVFSDHLPLLFRLTL